MKLVCASSTCQQVNDFSEPVIKSLFIAGLNDMELEQDQLAEQELSLEKAVQMAGARETAKSSQVILDGNQQAISVLSTYKKGLKKFKVPPDCCLNCGQKKHSDTSDCPAKDNKCSCGIIGHFRNICMYDGKPKRNKGVGKQETKKEESDSKEETSHGIEEHCFSLQAEGETSRGTCTSTGPLWSPPPAFTQPNLPPKQPPVIRNTSRKTRNKRNKSRYRRNTSNPRNNCSKETQPAVKYECIPTTAKVGVDKYLSGMTTDSLSSDQMINEEHCPEQYTCLLYTSPSPRDRTRSRMPSSA